MSYVVDTSVVIRLLAADPGDELLRLRLSRAVHAPAVIDAEVSSTLRGLNLTSKPEFHVDSARVVEALQDYGDLRIVRYEMVPLQRRVHELRHNLTAYDAMYVALAEALELPLLTCDKKFAGASGHHADIVEYPN